MAQDVDAEDDLPMDLSDTEIKSLVSRAMAKSCTITPIDAGIRLNGEVLFAIRVASPGSIGWSNRKALHVVCLHIEEIKQATGGENSAIVNTFWQWESLRNAACWKEDERSFTLTFKKVSNDEKSTFFLPRTWTCNSSTQCKEMLWGISILHKLLAENSQPSDIIETTLLKELQTIAVYERFFVKYPLVNALLNESRNDSHGILSDAERRGGVYVGEPSRGDSSNNKMDHQIEVREPGEATLEKLDWKLSHQEVISATLSRQLGDTERGTTEQLLLWGENNPEADALLGLLEKVDAQLALMDEWLEVNGKPLAEIQKDIASIQGQNHSYKVEWDNYESLCTYVGNIVNTFSLSPNADALYDLESVLGDPEAFAYQSVENVAYADEYINTVVAALDVLQKKLKETDTLLNSKYGGSLGAVVEGSTSMSTLAKTTTALLKRWLCSYMNELAMEVMKVTRGENGQIIVSADDKYPETLLMNQQHFHSCLVDFEPIFQKLLELDPDVAVDIEEAYLMVVDCVIVNPVITQYMNSLRPTINEHCFHGISELQCTSICGGDGGSILHSPTKKGDDHNTARHEIHSSPAEFILDTIVVFLPVMGRENVFFTTLFRDGGKGTTNTVEVRVKQNGKMIPDDDSQGLPSMVDQAFVSLITGLRELLMDTVMIGDICCLISILYSLEALKKSKLWTFNSSAVVVSVVSELERLAGLHMDKFVKEQIAWLSSQKVDGKRAGVLAAVAKFPAFIDAMEAAVTQATCFHSLSKCGGVHCDEGKEYPKQLIEAYRLLGDELFELIEACARTNPKYSDMVRLENYYFFCEAVGTRNVDILQDYVRHAHEVYEAASSRFVQWLMVYRFPTLVDYFTKMEDLLSSVGASDVKYHESHDNVESFLKRHCQENFIQEGLEKIHDSISKYVCNESCRRKAMWETLCDNFFAMFSRWEELCAMCYKIELKPSAAQVCNMVLCNQGAVTPGHNNRTCLRTPALNSPLQTPNGSSTISGWGGVPSSLLDSADSQSVDSNPRTSGYSRAISLPHPAGTVNNTGVPSPTLDQSFNLEHFKSEHLNDSVKHGKHKFSRKLFTK